jgi:microcystin-dependent protein
MGWSFFTKAGVRKKENFNAAPATGSIASNQAGLVIPFAGAPSLPSFEIPDGWLLCDGRTMLRADYPKLFAAISTTYNIGTVAGTSFMLPDLSDYRAILGDTAGSRDGQSGSGEITGGTAIGSQLVGTRGGEYEVTLSGAESATAIHYHPTDEPGHHHTIADPGHTHSIQVQVNQIHYTGAASATTGARSYNYDTGFNDKTSYAGDTTVSVNSTNAADYFTIDSAAEAPANLPHNNMQPFVGMLYIIKT